MKVPIFGHEREPEEDILDQFLRIMAEKKEAANAKFASHFGHLDQDTLTRVMKVVRVAMFTGDRDGLQQLLSEKQIIVPGDNEISREQLELLYSTYAFNRPHWDRLIDSSQS